MEIINHETYVSLEIAKLLKKVGFNWEVKTYYHYLLQYDEYNLKFDTISTNYNYFIDTNFSAPTLEVAQKWLREVKNIAIYVCPAYEPISIGNNVDDKWIIKWQVAAINYNIEFDEIDLEDVKDKIFDIYEEAQEAGIKKVIEIILEKGE